MGNCIPVVSDTPPPPKFLSLLPRGVTSPPRGGLGVRGALGLSWGSSV